VPTERREAYSVAVEIDPGKHSRKILLAFGIVVLVLVFVVARCARHDGGSTDKVPTLDTIPVDAILGPCDPDGCQLWWEYDDALHVWHLHAGTVAAAQDAIANGAMLVRVPQEVDPG